MRLSSILAATATISLLGGCVASKVVTAPFRVAGTAVETAVDATTQSQSEKEEDLGRRILAERKQERKACLKRAENKAERKQCKKNL
ncbi:DUF6726 family protein [Parasphingorhabdus sp. JC815]|uniref:DUF6726 family protein n=1 Tax=Parasphingorhabdus sp. JC815 TaxID=3232140 RepID=UPI00345AE46A